MTAKISYDKHVAAIARGPVHAFSTDANGLKPFSDRGEFVPMMPKTFAIDLGWLKTRGSGIKVALLDTGIDLNHPDFAGAIDKVKDFTKEGETDENGHGTHMAGIVGARQNGMGMVGIAPECRLLIGKVMNKNGFGTVENICKGIDWAVKEGATIISLSISVHMASNLLYHSIHSALAAGVCVICAAGNKGGLSGNIQDPPASYGSVITVGAHDREGRPCSFNSVGGDTKLLAPGSRIWSCFLDGGYACLSGTSPAVPFVAGLSALILSKHRMYPDSKTPIFNNEDLERHLIRMTASPGTFKMGEGYGVLEPLKYADTSIQMVKDSSITIDMVKDSSITHIVPAMIEGRLVRFVFRNIFPMAA